VLIKDDKVNIKLRKINSHDWHHLFGSGLVPDKKKESSDEEEEEERGEDYDPMKARDKKLEKKRQERAEANYMGPKMELKDDEKKKRPYASTRDWDAIDKDLKRQEEEDKEGGEVSVLWEE